jgi:photosystem II stability/assembly factor-like uncharacterized protein
MRARFFSIVVAFALAFWLAACANQTTPLQQKATDSNAAAPSSAPQGRWFAGTDISKFDLLAIDFVDAQNGWTVGDISPEGGPLLRSTDGGNSWQVIAKITEVFASIQFVNASTGWMAGYAGRIERTDDGGRTWKTQRFEREGEVLNSLYFVDKEFGWAVGGRGLVCHTTNGGNSWEQMPTNRVEDLWAVRFSSRERGWIVGEDGLIISTTDGGNNWTQQKSGTTKALFGLAILPTGTLVAVGEGGTILRGENGSDWKAVSSGAADTLNAVAADKEMLVAVGASGLTLSSNDEGKSWTIAAPVSTKHLLAVDLIDSRRGIAVGKRGAIQRLQ